VKLNARASFPSFQILYPESFYPLTLFATPRARTTVRKTGASKAGLFLEALAGTDEFEDAFAEMFAELLIELFAGTRCIDPLAAELLFSPISTKSLSSPA